MVTRLGTILGTTLGTDIGGMGDVPAPVLYALSSISAANYYQTLANGGEAGIATGFGGVALVIPRVLQSTNQLYAGRLSASAGWQTGVVNTNDFSLYTFPFLQVSNKLGNAKAGRVLVDIFQATPTQSKIMQDRLDTSTATTLTSYTPADAASVEQIGMAGSASPSTATDHIGHLRWRGTPTDAHLIALADLIRTLGDVPSKAAAEAVMPGTTITHRWSLRDVLATGGGVVDGQVAPATIPDTATAASIDAMARQGSPTVRVIDTSIDGRRSYGALGFSTTSRLETAAGIRGGAVGGTWVAVLAELVSAANSESFAASITNPAGWDLIKYNGTLLAGRRDAGGFYVSTNPYTFTTGDVGRPILVGFHHTGAQLRTMLDGVLLGSDAAASAMQPSATPMQVGVENNTSYAATTAKIYGVVGGDGFYPTPGEWAQLYADVKRTGRIQAIPGKTTHLYDLTADIVANGGPSAGIPATVQDRVGTDHLTRVGGFAIVSNGAATGLRGFVASTNILSTPAGFAGASAFWASALAAPQTLTGIRILFGKSNHGTAGWSFGFNGSYIVTYIADGGVNTAGPQFNMGAGAGYLNTPTHIAMVLSAGTLTLYVNGAAVGTPLAVAAYSPGTTAMVIGANNGGALHPATSVDIFGACGGHFAPTAGEIATAAAASLSTGVITAVPAKTSHRYDLKADIADAGGAVPVRSVERTSGVDTMMAVNAKLEVASRAERLWSYESTPIMHGARNWSLTNLLSTAGGVASGAVASYWFAIALVINAKAGTAFQVIACKANAAGAQGYNVYTSGTNGTLVYSHGNGAAPVTGGSYAIATASVGKVILAFGQWTGAATQFYVDRVKQGSDTATGAYTPYAGAFNIGRHPDSTSNPATDNVSVLGFMGGSNAFLSLAEVQAASDAFIANEDFVAVPGKTDRLWSVKRAQNGSLQPILDAQGSGETLAITGAPTLAPLYSRAFNW